MHGHEIDGMLAGDGVSARALRLHLDNSHDERTTGWDFARLHALHQELHGPRLAEIEAAANLISERLAAAPAVVVEAVVGREPRYATLTEAGTQALWRTMAVAADLLGEDHQGPAMSSTRRGVIEDLRTWAERLTGWPVQGHEMSEAHPFSDAAGGAEGAPGSAAAPSAAPHVWTCALKGGADTCECEEFARS